ncbi:hypothetical protein [Gemmatimonas sp.]|jgi:hypothetical protein|uniref:hypothetical protein n=3 Tax=Gemmatimonas sp. TaxID=1962908 RepID=UPI0022CAE9C6|nr:hypothetical protein [Gemmatimonas sp.]MCA2982168.1 hypothetical protein [Gemmatimonas sp.]MCA2986636.1 hypothetical protein [Gemmatimonas sp.]MCA2991273.1 hypothetical protein [Gemmatimonas sp.]MCA2995254.1 hypothetical protein [Gemmatimonas sp.]MCE2952815.1 hypothetical protein [Gemmatimonas sp.]
MFPRDFYEILHIIGIAMLFLAIGGVATHAANGGTKAESKTRGLMSSMHGIGALLILVGGFGMLARIGFQHGSNFPGWLWVKIIVWLVLSAIVLLPYRKPALARPFIFLLPLLAGVAVYMALYKPF